MVDVAELDVWKSGTVTVVNCTLQLDRFPNVAQSMTWMISSLLQGFSFFFPFFLLLWVIIGSLYTNIDRQLCNPTCIPSTHWIIYNVLTYCRKSSVVHMALRGSTAIKFNESHAPPTTCCISREISFSYLWVLYIETVTICRRIAGQPSHGSIGNYHTSVWKGSKLLMDTLITESELQ